MQNQTSSRGGEAHGTEDDSKQEAAPSTADPPEEKLAFALSDGRVGILSVLGRKVTFSIFYSLIILCRILHPEAV